MVEMMSRGCTHAQVAAKLGVAESQIQYDWKQLRLEMVAHRGEKGFEEAVAVRERQYLEVIRVAWEEFELSKVGATSLLDDGNEPPPPTGDMNCLRVVLTAFSQLDNLEGLQIPKRKLVDASVDNPEDAEHILETLLPVVKRALEVMAQKKTTSESATQALSDAAKLGLTLPVIPLESNTSQPDSQPNTVILPPDDDFDLEQFLSEREKNNDR